MNTAAAPGDLALVWYVEAQGIHWEEPPPGPQAGPAEEAYRLTGNHELWLMDGLGGEILARAGAGVLACATYRPGAPPSA